MKNNSKIKETEFDNILKVKNRKSVKIFRKMGVQIINSLKFIEPNETKINAPKKKSFVGSNSQFNELTKNKNEAVSSKPKFDELTKNKNEAVSSKPKFDELTKNKNKVVNRSILKQNNDNKNLEVKRYSKRHTEGINMQYAIRAQKVNRKVRFSDPVIDKICH